MLYVLYLIRYVCIICDKCVIFNPVDLEFVGAKDIINRSHNLLLTALQVQVSKIF